MPLLTFIPPVDPSPGTTLAPDIELNETGFGDGYVQNSPVGLNHMREQMTLKWEGLNEADRAQIVQFFRDHGGVKPFLYAHPSDGVTRQYTCKAWSSTLGVPRTVKATFKQDFTPV